VPPLRSAWQRSHPSTTSCPSAPGAMGVPGGVALDPGDELQGAPEEGQGQRGDHSEAADEELPGAHQGHTKGHTPEQ